MTDFLAKLAERTLGWALTAQPIIAPMFAPGPDMSGDYGNHNDYDGYTSGSAGLSPDTPAQVSTQVDESSGNLDSDSHQPSIPARETLPSLSRSDPMPPNLMTKSDPLSATTRQLAPKTPDTQPHSDHDPEPYHHPNPKSEPFSPSVQAETMSLDTHLDIHDVYDVYMDMVTEQDEQSNSFSTTSSQLVHKTPDIHIHLDPRHHSKSKPSEPSKLLALLGRDEAMTPGAMTRKDDKKDDLVVFTPTPISPLVPSEDSLLSQGQGSTDGAPVRLETLAVRTLSEQKRSASQAPRPPLDSDASNSPDSPDSTQPDIPEAQSAVTHIRRPLVPGVIRPQLSDHLEPMAPMAPMAPILADQGAAASGSSSSTTTIRVIIGRIEVRAMLPPPTLPPQRTSPAAPKLSLDDYLRSRNGGKR